MNLNTANLAKLQYSLLAALLMAAIGAGSVYFALDMSKAAKLARSAAQAERNEFAGKLDRVRSEEREIKQKSAVFAELQKRGVVGEEQRLEWVELLKDIRDKRRLIDLQYEFAPQRALEITAAGAPASAYAFYASSMKMQVKLLHEEDLTRLLGDLRQQAAALIQIKACKLSRMPRGAGDWSLTAQLQADCLIDWITLRETAGRPGAPK